MKYVLITILITVTCSCLFAQTFEQDLEKHNRKLLEQALESGDFNTAIAAVQSLITMQQRNVSLYDTLVSLYLASDNNQGVMYNTKRIIDLDPTNLKALDNHANAAKNLKQYGEAITTYNRLYQLKKNTKYLYEIATQYHAAKDEATAQKVMEQIINSPDSKKDSITMFVAEGISMKAPVLAVTYNYLGYLSFSKGKKEDARYYYQKALEVFPNFILATNNLENLDK